MFLSQKLKTNLPLFSSILLFTCFLLMQIFRSVALEGEAKYIDLRWIYTAGKCWILGLSPYNQEIFYQMWESLFGSAINGRPYVYPPVSALFAMPLALFSWDYAKVIFDWASVGILVGSFLLIGGLIKDNSRYNFSSPRLWVALAMGCSVAMISAAIFTGQTPLFALLGCLGALYYGLSERPIKAAAYMVLASLKPQLALIPLLLLLLRRPWTFLLGTVGILGFTGAIYLFTYEKSWWKHLGESLALNLTLSENQYGNLTLIYRLFESFFLGVSRFWIAMIGPGLLLLTWFSFPKEAQKQPDTQLILISLAFILTAVFAPLHNYDLSILCVSIAIVMTFTWQWVLLFLPGVILTARPASLVFMSNYFWNTPLPFTSDELTIYLGTTWLLVLTLIKVIYSLNKRDR